MFTERIREHAAWVADMLDAYPDIARIEARTKSSLIEPLLRCLGYDPNDPGQVELEAAIRGKKVDYMLTGEKDAKVAVEAKPAKTTLSEKEMDQLDTYFHHSEAVAGVLTNGVDCWLFTDLDKTNVMDSEPYRKIDITQLNDNDIHHLETLTRDNLHQGAVREEAQRERYRRLVNEIVAEELRSPSLEFLKLVGKSAGIKPLTKANLAFLGPLVTKAVRGQMNQEAPPDPSPKVPPTASAPTPSPKSPSPGPRAAATRKQFRGATLFGQELSATSYREVLTSVVAELQIRHGKGFATLVRNEKIFRGKKWWYVSTEQDHLAPKRNKYKVRDHWVDTNLNAKDMVRRARLFLNAFGHDPDELAIHPGDG